MSFSGIKISAPNVDALTNKTKYKEQLLSTNAALIEEKSGESNINVMHGRRGAYPLVLTSKIDSSLRTHALKAEDIDSTKVLISSKKFFRILLNEQTLTLDFSFEPDMVGEYKEIAFSVVPVGWLECNGQAVSRTTYADLFALIGTTFGVGDGSTTFNLPNRSGKVSVGLDGSQVEFNTIGKTGGAKTHTLSTAEMPSHTHAGITSSSNIAGAVTGSVIRDNGSATNSLTGSTGDGGAHNNLQPYIVSGIVIIKY